MENKKPSFLKSVATGIAGYVKGFIAGGIVGMMGGAVIGAIGGALTGGLAPALAAAAIGAGWGGALLASIGAVAGTVTNVVESREKGQPSSQDIVNLANITFAQGVATGEQLAQNKTAEESLSNFRERELARRAAPAQQNQSVR